MIRKETIKMTKRSILFVGLLLFSHTNVTLGDRTCSDEALWYIGSLAEDAWSEFTKQNFQLVEDIVRNHSWYLKNVLDAQSIGKQLIAAEEIGKDNVSNMEQMFKQGMIAFSDLIYAHCPETSTQANWSEGLKEEYEKIYCEELANSKWPIVAIPFFCDKQKFCDKMPDICN